MKIKKNKLILAGLIGMALMFMLLLAGCPDPNTDPDDTGTEIPEPPLDHLYIEGKNTVVVDSSRKYQYVRGFGGMSNAWNTGAGQDINAADMEEMFDPAKLGYNMFRIMIYPYPISTILDNTQFPNHDNSDYYELVKIVNRHGGYVLASPWTMPAEMKELGTLNGGDRLLPAQYHNYAEYLKDYLRDMNTNGAPVYAISIQNEPNWAATYDGCDWTPEEMRDWFKQEGHFTDGIPGYGGGQASAYVLTMNGESANHPRINDAALDDPQSAAAIDVIGRHIYGNAQVRYTKALKMGKEVWMTEHNVNGGNASSYPNDSTWNYVWKFMNEVDLSMRLNDESAFIWWYAKRFYSMIGDGDYATADHAVLPRGHGLSHYAKYAKETTRVRVATNISGANPAVYKQDGTAVKITAYESKDGNSISLVLFTPTDTQGANGTSLEEVVIRLMGFNATSAEAIVSNAGEKRVAKPVTVSTDEVGTVSTISLPASTIMSVRFSK